MTNNDGSGYANPDVLVDADWVAEHRAEPGVRLVEVDVDTRAYDQGHIAGAVGWNWQIDTQAPVTRDIPDADAFSDLLERSGITPDTTVILYGDNNNWFAAYAFWLLKLYGHGDARLLNGGRARWVADGRPLTTEIPEPSRTVYPLDGVVQGNLRALRSFVEASVGNTDRALVDVRSPAEFSGEKLAPDGVPQEGAQRGGHIPGAANISWSAAVAEDGTFKAADELRQLYESAGITRDKEVIAYCRIGERSSFTWFVLNQLLGYERVRNYDGSWTEWGSSIGVPIAKSA